MAEFKQEKDDFEMEIVDLNDKKEAVAKDAEDEQVNIFKEILSILGTMAIAAGLVFLLKEFIIINAFIPSSSMENAIMPGDRVIGNRLAYLSKEPERGDIVIFLYPDDESQLFVKRVVGLPGEEVVIEDAKVYVEGILLEEPYLKEEWLVGNDSYAFEIPEGSYLVLGDNRNNSKDARYWDNTYVEEDKILGEAVFRYWPFDSIGTLK